MRFLGKSKIGRLSAYKGKIYPQIRLPSHLADTIGEVADVFETEHDGKRAFLLATKQRVLNADNVLQSFYNIVTSDDERDIHRRLEAVESQIKELRSLLLLNESFSYHDIEKRGHESGLEAIRTPDLRRVKAMS
jgi:hypothetical protein